MSNLSYGLEAEFKIIFNGTIQELAAKISEGLSISGFWFDNSMDSPYNNLALCEVFGFEVEIQEIAPNEYLFIAMTTNSFKEIANGRMHDFSIWFSKYISFACKLDNIIL